ncbi:MAG TPA: TerB family tellurite resistance protein [Stellaceae bacterium]|nr:TerB family tellurite resistance protein [Stellaceae bacterium]
MSFISRILANARELPFGGAIGSLIERAADHLPHHHPSGEGEPRAAHPRRSIAFTIAAIALGAKMAKADGEVSREEVAAFREVFQVPPGEEEHVRLVFDLARKSTHGFESYAHQVGRLFAGDRGVLENLLGGLFHIALADGTLAAAEDAYLAAVAHQFGFKARDYARIKAQHVGGEEDGAEDAYMVLGVPPGARPEELRAAYHRLLHESHPDIAIARGLPPECVALATTRMARINAAYDRLSGRGLQQPA